MDEIKIEKGVPLPVQCVSGTPIADTMRKMEVGDSIVLPVAKRGGVASLASRLRIKIAVRKIDNDSIRVWRIE